MNDEELFQLKARWKEIETASAKLKSLLVKREELEETLQNLSKDKHEKEIKLLKSKKIELDHYIDLLESSEEESPLNLKERLTEKILVLHPDQLPFYSGLAAESAFMKKTMQVIQVYSDKLIEIRDHLQSIIEIRLRIRRLGIFSYIFGASPNHMIAQHLESIHRLIQQTPPETLLQDRPLYQQSQNTLIELSEHCLQRWGFHKIETCFQDYKEKISGLILEWESVKAQQKLEMTALGGKLNAWIEEMTL